MMFVDDTVLFTAAAVRQVLPYTSLEEAFAALTTDGSIVTTWERKTDKVLRVTVFWSMTDVQ